MKENYSLFTADTALLYKQKNLLPFRDFRFLFCKKKHDLTVPLFRPINLLHIY